MKLYRGLTVFLILMAFISCNDLKHRVSITVDGIPETVNITFRTVSHLTGIRKKKSYHDVKLPFTLKRGFDGYGRCGDQFSFSLTIWEADHLDSVTCHIIHDEWEMLFDEPVDNLYYPEEEDLQLQHRFSFLYDSEADAVQMLFLYTEVPDCPEDDE